MSNQIEIKYMLATLKSMHQQLGGDNARKVLAGTQFDFIQEEFLVERHQVQKLQDVKQKQGFSKENADVPHRIREGVKKMEDLLDKLKKQYARLEKKKKDPEDILKKKKKIVENCELLFRDVQDRLYSDKNPNSYQKPMTLTDMKTQLLNEIDTANYDIHHRANSEDKLSSLDDEEVQAIDKYKQVDKQQDIMLDEIIVGVQGVRKKVKNINEKQDEINQKVDGGNKEAKKLENRLQTDNQKLKKVLDDMKPNRCCLAIFLMLLLIGLVVVIIKFLVPQEGEPAETTTT